MKRTRALVAAAVHNVGSKEAPETARFELENLLKDMKVYALRLEELLRNMEEKLKGIPYVDKLMEIKGIGMVTVNRFLQRWETLDVLIIPSNCRSWQDSQS